MDLVKELLEKHNKSTGDLVEAIVVVANQIQWKEVDQNDDSPFDPKLDYRVWIEDRKQGLCICEPIMKFTDKLIFKDSCAEKVLKRIAKDNKGYWDAVKDGGVTTIIKKHENKITKIEVRGIVA